MSYEVLCKRSKTPIEPVAVRNYADVIDIRRNICKVKPLAVKQEKVNLIFLWV